MSTKSKIRKKIKNPWLEPTVGDIVVLEKEYSNYDGLIVDVAYAPSSKLASDNMFDVLWIESGEITRESSTHIRQSYTLLENDTDKK